MELTLALAIIPSFRTNLILTISNENQTTINKIIIQFRDTLSIYSSLNYGGNASPDLILINFIKKVENLSNVNLKNE